MTGKEFEAKLSERLNEKLSLISADIYGREKLKKEIEDFLDLEIPRRRIPFFVTPNSVADDGEDGPWLIFYIKFNDAIAATVYGNLRTLKGDHGPNRIYSRFAVSFRYNDVADALAAGDYDEKERAINVKVAKLIIYAYDAGLVSPAFSWKDLFAAASARYPEVSKWKEVADALKEIDERKIAAYKRMVS